MANNYEISRSGILVLREGKTVKDLIELNKKLTDSEIPADEYPLKLARVGIFSMSPAYNHILEDCTEIKKPLLEGIGNDRCVVFIDATIEIYENENSNDYIDVMNEFFTLMETVFEPGQLWLFQGVQYCKRRYTNPFRLFYIRDELNDTLYTGSTLMECIDLDSESGADTLNVRDILFGTVNDLIECKDLKRANELIKENKFKFPNNKLFN